MPQAHPDALRMQTTSDFRNKVLGAKAVAGLAIAAWVEHSSRVAEREHPAPHRIMYIDGTRLHYEMRGPEQGDRPPVLLLHGNLLHGSDFEASGLVDRLSREHQVIVIDRPGFGWSDRPRGKAWTPAEQARLLRRALGVLGVRKPVIVGHSMGTQVAMAMALQEPSNVAGLVLVGGYYWPGFRLDRWVAAPAAVPVLGDVLRYTSGALTARATLGAAVRAMFDPMPVPHDFQRYLPRELLLRPLQQRATAEDGSRMNAQARAFTERYGTLRPSLTLIAGGDDRVVSPEQSMRLHRAVPGSELHVLAGVGHMAHHAAQDLIAGAVRRAGSSGRGATALARDGSATGNAPSDEQLAELAGSPT